jgi:hypothetical protein
MGVIVPGEIEGRSVAVLLVWVITQTAVKSGPAAGRKGASFYLCVHEIMTHLNASTGGRKSKREMEREQEDGSTFCETGCEPLNLRSSHT